MKEITKLLKEGIEAAEKAGACKTLEFKKEYSGWYIILPKWKGNKSALQMVSGADTLLDILGNNKNKVSIIILLNKKNWKKKSCMVLQNSNESGANYIYYGKGFNHKLWLCPVTLFVFGEYPKQIFIKSIISA